MKSKEEEKQPRKNAHAETSNVGLASKMVVMTLVDVWDTVTLEVVVLSDQDRSVIVVVPTECSTKHQCPHPTTAGITYQLHLRNTLL